MPAVLGYTHILMGSRCFTMTENPYQGTICDEGIVDDGNHMSNTTSISDPANVSSDFDSNLEAFCEVFLATGKKPSTIYTNKRYLVNMAKSLHGKDPASWTEDDVTTFILSERFVGWSPGTQKTAKAILKAYWQVHSRPDLLMPNLYFFWKDKRSYGGGSNNYDRLKSQCPTPSEVETVLAVCKDVILTSEAELEVYRHMALYFAAAYGLRRMEVANLRSCDIDLSSKTLHIERSKGDKSRDVLMDVEITPKMWECFMAARSSIIARLRVDAADHVIANLGSLSDRAAPLFFIRENGDTGKGATPGTMGSMLARLATHILNRRVNAHAFRHAKIFYLIEVRGIDANHVMAYVGHSTIQQTLDYCYTGIEEMRVAFQGALPVPIVVEPVSASPGPPGGLDVAVSALTAAFSRGELSVAAFAAAVTALSSGSV